MPFGIKDVRLPNGKRIDVENKNDFVNVAWAIKDAYGPGAGRMYLLLMALSLDSAEKDKDTFEISVEKMLDLFGGQFSDDEIDDLSFFTATKQDEVRVANYTRNVYRTEDVYGRLMQREATSD